VQFLRICCDAICAWQFCLGLHLQHSRQSHVFVVFCTLLFLFLLTFPVESILSYTTDTRPALNHVTKSCQKQIATAPADTSVCYFKLVWFWQPLASLQQCGRERSSLRGFVCDRYRLNGDSWPPGEYLTSMRLSFSIQSLRGATGDWINHAYVAVDDTKSAIGRMLHATISVGALYLPSLAQSCCGIWGQSGNRSCMQITACERQKVEKLQFVTIVRKQICCVFCAQAAKEKVV